MLVVTGDYRGFIPTYEGLFPVFFQMFDVLMPNFFHPPHAETRAFQLTVSIACDGSPATVHSAAEQTDDGTNGK